MRKLTLNLDALRVESFETDDGQGEVRGTVRGQGGDCSNYNSCWCQTGEAPCTATVPITEFSCLSNIIACPIFYTDQSCGYGCEASDGASCTFCNSEDRTCWYC